MAFQKINSRSNAIGLKKKGDKVQGYLVGVQLGAGKRKNSTIYSIQQKDGTIQKVWGSFAIDGALCELDKDNEPTALIPSLKGVAIRLTLTEIRDNGKKGKASQTFKDIDVEVDMKDRIKPAKSARDYMFKK